MSQGPPTIEAETQQVLDELWNEGLILFALSVGKVIRVSDEYTIHFHDARMRTVSVLSHQDHSFRAAVRAAVLARVERLSGPLKNWKKTLDSLNRPTDTNDGAPPGLAMCVDAHIRRRYNVRHTRSLA